MEHVFRKRVSDACVWAVRNRLISVGLPVGVLLLATAGVFSYLQRAEQARFAIEFQGETRAYFDRLHQRFDVYLGVVQSVSSFYDASAFVDRQEFKQFTGSALARHLGIQALEWIPRVQHDMRVNYEQAAETDGVTGFRFKKWTQDTDTQWSTSDEKWADDYFPVYYVEPMEANQQAVGIDLGSNPDRLRTLQQACETGQAMATPRVELAQGTGDRSGFLLIYPVFKRNMPTETVDQRKKNLLGFVAGVFRFDKIVDGALPEWDIPGIEMQVRDLSAEGKPELLYKTELSDQGDEDILRTDFTYALGGRLWQFQFTPTEQYITAHRRWSAWWIVFGGAFVALLVGVISNMLSGRAEKIEGVVLERTEELRQSNAALARNARELTESQARLEELHDQLRQEASVAEQANQAKTEFLANMSHELRTPLNSLLILAKMLNDNDEKNLTPMQLEMTQVIHDGGRELLLLINDLLDLAKVEAGKLEAFIEPVELRELNECLYNQIVAQATHKGIKLECLLDNDFPEIVCTDEQKVVQVLRNLLSNAIKFTTEGSVTLRIGHPDAEAKFSNTRLTPDQTVAFAVSDTGIGIPEDKQKDIFESFQQADDSTCRKFGGTGLGLSISREFAKLLGGEVLVESASGVGSTFTLCLPLEEGQQTKNDMEKPEKDTNGPPKELAMQSESQTPVEVDDRLRGKKVLLVDDDVRNLFAISTVLESSGMVVQLAENGQAALELLRGDPSIDIVLTDIIMPIMDGYEVIRTIRSEQGFEDLPIFAITAKAMETDKEKCLAAGANEYMPKPVDINELLSLLQEWLFNERPTPA